ncbi:NTP transferase domain-containing protein [Fulvivirgaceae bacterium LMO-SS25]
MNSIIDNVAIAILAAGESKRMGSPKAFLQIEGETLLDRTIATAKSTNAQNIFLITGAYHNEMLQVANMAGIKVLFNEDWQEGMSSSLRRAIEAVGDLSNLKGLLVLLIDQPYVDRELLKLLISKFEENPEKPVTSFYKNVNGVPAIFPRVLWNDLLEISGDKGARQLLQKREDVISIPFPKGAIDLDFPEDFEQIKRADI